MLAELLGLVAPPRCAVCARECGPREHLCERCESGLHGLAPSSTPVAGLDAAWSAAPYEGVARDLVVALKFAARLRLARRAGAVIAERAPAELLHGPVSDPNQAALVILAEWRHLSLLLTADAEAEAVPIDPGAVDVLKVAHHGSEDAGLGTLLERTVPKLAVISVGEGNSYGHPTAEALAELQAHQVPTVRTDQAGTVTIEADERGWWVESG